MFSFISAVVIEDSDGKQLRGAKDLFHLVGHLPTLRELRTGPQAGLGSGNSRGALLVGSLTDSCLTNSHLNFFFFNFQNPKILFSLGKEEL